MSTQKTPIIILNQLNALSDILDEYRDQTVEPLIKKILVAMEGEHSRSYFSSSKLHDIDIVEPYVYVSFARPGRYELDDFRIPIEIMNAEDPMVAAEAWKAT